MRGGPRKWSRIDHCLTMSTQILPSRIRQQSAYLHTNRSTNKEVKLLRHVVLRHRTHCAKNFGLFSSVVVNSASLMSWTAIPQPWLTRYRVTKLSSSAATSGKEASHLSSRNSLKNGSFWMIPVRTANVRPERHPTPPSMVFVAANSNFRRSR